MLFSSKMEDDNKNYVFISLFFFIYFALSEKIGNFAPYFIY